MGHLDDLAAPEPDLAGPEAAGPSAAGLAAPGLIAPGLTASGLGDAGLAEPELAALGLAELRALRRHAQQDEADLSYLRRLLQGRVDILRAELDRRSGAERGGAGGAGRPTRDTLLEQLPEILADIPSQVRHSARHVTLATPSSRAYRALADELMSDARLADLAEQSDEQLQAACIRLTAHERGISARRQRLQRTVDGCSAEITRRYREGEARVDDLLSGG